MRINYETDLGAIADDNSLNVQLRNGHLLNITISNSSTFPPGSTLYIPPKVFNLMGGIISKGLHNVTIELAGTLKFSFDVGLWPRNNSTGKVLDSLDFRNVSDFKITNGASSTSTPNIPISHKNLGIIDGQGGSWWDIPWSDKFGYLKNKNDRPRLLNIEGGLRMVIEKILFYNAPFWTTNLVKMDDLIIRWCGVSARRTWREAQKMSLFDSEAFSTDGFDISGRNVLVQDCNCYSQDDCFTVKDSGGLTYPHVSENFVFERLNASGMALTIESNPNSLVRNITYKDVYIRKTTKGIYLKVFEGGGRSRMLPLRTLLLIARSSLRFG